MLSGRRRTGYVLGLNLGFHESSAALLRDGSLRWLVEQERLSRRKRALGQPPVDAARACLAAEGIGLDLVDAIAVGWDFSRTPLATSRRFTDEGLRRLLFPDAHPDEMPPVRWVPHHLAHAACAFYSSGEREAAVLVVDGAGETQATTLGRAGARGIQILREWPMSQSLGFFYASASKWAGLGEWGAGKLMGLAAYGRARPGLPLRCADGGYVLDLGVVPEPAPDGKRPRLSLMSFPPSYEAAVGAAFAEHFPYVSRTGEDAISYADLAASVQQAIEQAMLSLAAEARRRVEAPALVLAGGVAMNCSMVGRMVRDGPFERVYVPPVPADAGVSLGGALVAASELGGPVFCPARIEHPYWSLNIDSAGARAAVQGAGLTARRLPDEQIASEVAEAVAAGGVVAVARGRAEIGQRALGARSIVADPRDRRSHERLNIIKGREMWRPVAPSILREHLGELIEGTVGHPARFMLAASQVLPAQRRRLPAVTHVDGSARPHAVDRESSPFYWSLIERFRQLTGVPAVVNTSFNLAGEPIVSSASDAVATFLRAEGIDLLVLDELLVRRGT
jgi:predicted NodU family carbamoyl transferase